MASLVQTDSPLVGQGVAAGVPDYVGTRLDLKSGDGRCALDHPGEAGRGER
jgi:hypothetical protein